MWVCLRGGPGRRAISTISSTPTDSATTAAAARSHSVVVGRLICSNSDIPVAPGIIVRGARGCKNVESDVHRFWLQIEPASETVRSMSDKPANSRKSARLAIAACALFLLIHAALGYLAVRSK